MTNFTNNKQQQLLYRQMCRRAVLTLMALFSFYNLLFSQELEEANGIFEKKPIKSIFITGNTGGTNDQYILDLIVKDAEKCKDPTLLILGNSIPKKSIKVTSVKNSMRKQLEIISKLKDNAIYTPGNNEWATNGQKGVRDLEKFIEKNSKAKFYPGNGDPISKKDLTDKVMLITVDSQWYLENWNKNTYINDDSEIKSRSQFFLEFEDFLKKENKIKIVAIHHPMNTQSKQGLIANTGGFSSQDFQNQQYRSLRKRLMTVARQAENVIFVSGHDKDLQYLNQFGIPQIISGAAGNTHKVKNGAKGEFTLAENGYAKLDFYEDGTVLVHFYRAQGNGSTLVFSTTVLTPKKAKGNFDFIPRNSFKSKQSAAIYTREETKKGGFYKSIWGDHYRKFYGTEIAAPVVFLDTLFGGLKPLKRGGGQQSKSLRLEDGNGKEYVMRALRKSTIRFLQANAFQDTYIGNALDGSVIDKTLLDFYTTANPYTPFAIGALSNAVEIYHTNPLLFYVPKQEELGEFNDEFGDELYMIEEHVGDTQTSLESFGSPKKILSTADVLEEILKNGKSVVDEPSYIRARLFDMLIGDWDRHEDQWRWALFENEDGTEYCKPIPRDRDQAFSKYDGALVAFLTRAIPGLRKMQSFDDELRSPKWFASSPYHLDINFIKSSDWSVWEKQAAYIQDHLTDVDIEHAFEEIPVELQGETIEDIKEKLRGRRSNITTIAKTYFDYLNKFEVLVGTQKDDDFKITRQDNGETTITIHRKDLGIFSRTYAHSITKEIWLYGLDGQDIFTVDGDGNDLIKIKILGGSKNDTYDFKNTRNVKLYDFKNKPNTIVNKGSKKWLVDDYDINNYDHKKVKHSANQILPIIAFNPDDGVRLGAVNHYSFYGIQSNPFTQKHTFSASYYTATSGYDLSYRGEFSNIFHHWNFELDGLYTSPNFARNFFGFGNDTDYDKDAVEMDFNRIRIKIWNLGLSLIRRGRDGGSFRFRPFIESFEVENTPDRFISSLSDTNSIFDRQTYGGAEIAYDFVNKDNVAFPTLGLDLGIKVGYKTNIDGGASDNSFAYIKPHVAIDHKLTKSRALVLATKLGGDLILGDNFEFYHAAELGGINSLRGFRNERFTGKYSFYQNTDLRLALWRIKTSIIPMRFGVTASFDYGRVWLENDTSDKWHNSTGGSLWISGLGFITANLGYFDSIDGGRVVFALGFSF
jgi:hypothetical protein